MEVVLQRAPNGALIPVDDEQAEKLSKIKAGVAVRAEIVQIRNYEFHKKFFSLISMLFDIWEETVPETEYRGVVVRANKTRFRKDLIILTGRFDATYNVRGEVRLEAHSISFGRMSQETFEQLFSDIIDVALKKVLNRPDLTEASIREHVDRILRYT